MEKEKLFFVDAETDGLNGPFISVAVIVTDLECNEIERTYCGINKKILQVTDSWTRENVVPILGDYEEVGSEDELLEKIWSMWIKYANNAYAIGDVIFPVEARLFQKCIYKNPEDRNFKAPFPFLDLSSMLYTSGVDPLIARKELVDDSIKEGQQHNALHDVEMMIRIYKKIGEQRISVETKHKKKT